MTQTNTTQNGNAINRIIERTDEITKRELSGNDPSYKIGDNPNEFYQNGTLPVQNASTQPTTQNKEELSEEQKIPEIMRLIKESRACILAFRCLMQVQMTDKSEGEKYNAVPETMVNNFFNILEKKVKKELNKSISQAHQSGIEEERKRIRNK